MDERGGGKSLRVAIYSGRDRRTRSCHKIAGTIRRLRVTKDNCGFLISHPSTYASAAGKGSRREGTFAKCLPDSASSTSPHRCQTIISVPIPDDFSRNARMSANIAYSVKVLAFRPWVIHPLVAAAVARTERPLVDLVNTVRSGPSRRDPAKQPGTIDRSPDKLSEAPRRSPAPPLDVNVRVHVEDGVCEGYRGGIPRVA